MSRGREYCAFFAFLVAALIMGAVAADFLEDVNCEVYCDNWEEK